MSQPRPDGISGYKLNTDIRTFKWTNVKICVNFKIVIIHRLKDNLDATCTVKNNSLHN